MSRRNEEHRIQAALFEWAKYASAKHPGLKLMFAIPNGGARDAVTGAMLKREGVKPGVPDIFLPMPVLLLPMVQVLTILMHSQEIRHWQYKK